MSLIENGLGKAVLNLIDDLPIFTYVVQKGETARMSTRLGELLVRKGYITPEQLRKAIEVQRLHGGSLNEHLVKLGCFTEDVLLAYLQREYRLPAADPANLNIAN